MTSSLGVAVLFVSLGMTKYVESSCVFSTIRNAHTERSSQLFFDEGEKVLITCFPGHATDGLQTEFMRTCTNGQWLPALQCNPITCAGLPVVEGADILYLSDMEVVDNMYPVHAVALVICDTGTSTDKGRMRYASACSYSSTWNDTSPCSVTLRPVNTQYSAYQVQLTETSLTFTPALSDPTSPQAQSLAQSLDRALFRLFEEEFGGSYVGSQDYVFSDSAQGLQLDFTMLFLPSVSIDPETLRLGISSALNRISYESSDPNNGTPYTFERNALDVSQEPVSQFTREATIGLSIAGALVAIMALTLIILCCCCRQNKKPLSVFNVRPSPRQNGFNGGQRPMMPYTARPVPAPAPAPAIVSPYAQISDVPYGLPRIQ